MAALLKLPVGNHYEGGMRFNALIKQFISVLPYLTDRLENPNKGIFGKAGPKASDCMRELGYLKAALEGIQQFLGQQKNETVTRMLQQFEGVEIKTPILLEYPSVQASIAANIKLFFDALDKSSVGSGPCNKPRINNFRLDNMSEGAGMLRIAGIKTLAADYIENYNQTIRGQKDQYVADKQTATQKAVAASERSEKSGALPPKGVEVLQKELKEASTLQQRLAAEAGQKFGPEISTSFKMFVRSGGVPPVSSASDATGAGGGQGGGRRTRKHKGKKRTTRRHRKSRRHQ